MSEPFTPTDASREIYRAILDQLGCRINDQFFAIWEAELGSPDAARRAGSVVASAYMALGARYAVFGAVSAGVEPRLDWWLELAEKDFHAAVEAVKEAYAIAGPSDAA